ncbi:MAG: hypothetical protein MK212_09235 [Saprospiraceae bacterium]|nr:hypothetical protein [Saprospiraceae bacterium]
MTIRYILFLILSIGTFLESQAQDFTQYFDNGIIGDLRVIKIDSLNPNNIWVVGQPQKTIFDSASTLPNALITDTIDYYPINDSSSFYLYLSANQLNTDLFVRTVHWQQKLDFEHGVDGGYIQFRTSQDTVWQNIFDNPYVHNYYGFDSTNIDTLSNGEIGFTGTDSTWRNVWACFDFSWFPDLELRYRLCTDSVQTNQEGWMIDDLIIGITIAHTVNRTEQTNYLEVYPNPSTGRVYINALKTQKKMLGFGFHLFGILP